MLANARLPGAPEILTLILASCESFAEVIAFASTCKEVYSVWKENAPPILDRLGPRCIPAFDEALVAVGDSFLSRYFHLSPIPSKHMLEMHVLIIYSIVR